MVNSNLNTKTCTDLNGWQNRSKVEDFILEHLGSKMINNYEYIIYMFIVKRSIGYNQYETIPLSIEYISESLNLGISTIKKYLKSLKDKGYIIRLKSNKTNEKFKSAYKYMLNFYKFKDKLYLNLKEPKEIEISSSGTKIQISEESISKLFRDFDSDKFYRFYKSNSELMELYKQYVPKAEDF